MDEACPCYTCRNFSRAYLRHLFLAGEITFSTLATLHNLRRYLDIMREIRQAILFGKVPEYLEGRARQNQVRAHELALRKDRCNIPNVACSASYSSCRRRRATR